MTRGRGSSVDLRGLRKHPVVHFVLIGSVLFGLNALPQGHGPPDDEAAIMIDRPRLEALAGPVRTPPDRNRTHIGRPQLGR